jgi:uncharacterized peroxidase-related enzyme
MTLPEYELLSQRAHTAQLSSAGNLPVVEEADASGEVALLYDHFRSHFGRQDIPGILKCFATHPPLLKNMMELSGALIFCDGFLTRKHKEMIATLVSSQNACEYCADSHGYFLRIHGGSAEVLCALQQNTLDSASLSAAEQALLGFVLKVNSSSAQVVPADIDLLRKQGWSDSQIAEAIHVAALFATFNRVVNAFGLRSQGLLALYNEDEAAIDPQRKDIRSVR